MAQVENKQEITDLEKQVESDLSSIKSSSITFNTDKMFGKDEGEKQDSFEILDADYLDSNFKSLFNEILNAEKEDFRLKDAFFDGYYLEAEEHGNGYYEISLDFASFIYNSEEHSCKISYYNRRKSMNVRGLRFIEKTIDITDKETFDYIESTIREAIESKDSMKLEKDLSRYTIKQSVQNLKNKNEVLGNAANSTLDGLLKK